MDYFLIAATNINNMIEFKNKFIKLFNMIDIGLCYYYLWIEVICNKKIILSPFAKNATLKRI